MVDQRHINRLRDHVKKPGHILTPVINALDVKIPTERGWGDTFYVCSCKWSGWLFKAEVNLAQVPGQRYPLDIES